MNVSILRLKYEYGARSESRFVLLPLLRHVVPLNDGNCRLTMPVGKGRCAHDALAQTFDIGMFKTVKKNYPTIQLIYN